MIKAIFREPIVAFKWALLTIRMAKQLYAIRQSAMKSVASRPGTFASRVR